MFSLLLEYFGASLGDQGPEGNFRIKQTDNSISPAGAVRNKCLCDAKHLLLTIT